MNHHGMGIRQNGGSTPNPWNGYFTGLLLGLSDLSPL